MCPGSTNGCLSIQELIQNADDARATEVAFLLDARENAYGVKKLVKESLKEFQGPALYTQNNAVFREEDWSGIQTPYESMKKEDPMKVGKFGIGFNSIYHLTGLRSFQELTVTIYRRPSV